MYHKWFSRSHAQDQFRGWLALAGLSMQQGRPEGRSAVDGTRLVKDYCYRIVAGHRHSATVSAIRIYHLVVAVIGPSTEVRPFGGYFDWGVGGVGSRAHRTADPPAQRPARTAVEHVWGLRGAEGAVTSQSVVFNPSLYTVRVATSP